MNERISSTKNSGQTPHENVFGSNLIVNKNVLYVILIAVINVLIFGTVVLDLELINQEPQTTSFNLHNYKNLVI